MTEAERIRLLSIELEAIQLQGDIVARDRRDAGGPDEKLEEFMLRLARARERLGATVERDR